MVEIYRKAVKFYCQYETFSDLTIDPTSTAKLLKNILDIFDVHMLYYFYIVKRYNQPLIKLVCRCYIFDSCQSKKTEIFRFDYNN